VVPIEAGVVLFGLEMADTAVAANGHQLPAVLISSLPSSELLMLTPRSSKS
jgi:hypothetical protein